HLPGARPPLPVPGAPDGAWVPGLPRAHVYLHRAYTFDIRFDNVAGLHRPHPLGSARKQDIARMQGVEGRCKLNKLGNTKNQVARVGALTNLPVYRQPKIKLRRVGELVGRYHPWAQYAVRVAGFT